MNNILFALLILSSGLIAQNNIQTIAHRGANKYAPENTIPAMLKAGALGIDFVELDVRETKDGVLIIMHDETIDRTTNAKGRVEDLEWSYLKHLDAGSWFNQEFTDTRIPSFKEALVATKGKIGLDIDFKEGDVSQLIGILREYNLLESKNIIFHSGNLDVLKKVNEIAPAMKVRTGPKLGWDNLTQLKEEYGVDIISFYAYRNKRKRIKQIQDAGLTAFVDVLHFSQLWGVKSKVKKCLKYKAAYIQSDKLDKILNLIEKFNLK